MSAGPATRWAARRPGVLALALATIVPLAAATAASRPPAAGPTGGNPIAYAISSTVSATVEAIDTVTNARVAEIPLLTDATGLAITPDARFVLTAMNGVVLGLASVKLGLPAQVPAAPELVAIDTTTNQIVPGVDASLPQGAAAIAVTPDGSRAYVVNAFDANCLSPCSPTGTVTPVTIGAGPKLTAGASVEPPNMPTPVDGAITPDGKNLLVLSSTGLVDELTLPSLTLAGSTQLPAVAHHIVVSPDGTTAYVSIQPQTSAPGEIWPVNLGPGLGSGPQIPGMPPNSVPDPLAIATTPAGKSTLEIGDQSLRILSQPLPSGPMVATSLTTVDNGPAGLFATPDGTELEMTTPNRDITVPIAGADHPPGTLGSCLTLPSCPPGNRQIAVTPDQAPHAAFVATPAPPGQASGFDASGSSITYRTIATYDWDFGDGTTQQTTTPTTTHTYAKTGSYTVALTETDWAGTSASASPPSTVFTGQTMTRRGGPEARTTRQVTISTTLPSSSASTTPTGPGPSPSTSPLPPGAAPKIDLLPKVGPPGTVVAVRGSGFPPNTALTLVWQPGIGTAGVTTDASGAFVNRLVLVFPKDQLGPRAMVARPYPVTTTFLVVPPPLSPGEQSLPIQLLFRG